MSSAWASVLQTTKSTPEMPFSYIVLTALEPPPPTPMTLMGELEDLGRSNCMRECVCEDGDQDMSSVSNQFLMLLKNLSMPMSRGWIFNWGASPLASAVRWVRRVS